MIFELPLDGEEAWQKYTTYKVGVYRGGGGAVTYVVSLPQVLKAVRCLMTGCPALAHSTSRLTKHFMYRSFLFRVAVVQEGREPLPCCYMCGMQMPAGWMIKYQWMQRCDRNTQMQWRRWDVAILSQCV